MSEKVVSEKKNKGERTRFPGVFWVANEIEILERFAYYGIYMGFGVYMSSLGFSSGQLGVVQTIFLFMSYLIHPVLHDFCSCQTCFLLNSLSVSVLPLVLVQIP